MDIADTVYFIAPVETPFIGWRRHNARRIAARSGASVRKRRRAIAKALFSPSDKNHKLRHEWVWS